MPRGTITKGISGGSQRDPVLRSLKRFIVKLARSPVASKFRLRGVASLARQFSADIGVSTRTSQSIL